MRSFKLTVLLIALLGATFFMQSCSATKTAVNDDNIKVAEQNEVNNLYKAIAKGGNVKLKKLTYYLDRPITIANKTNFSLDASGSIFIMKNKDEDVVLVENSKMVTLKNFKATHIEPSGPIGCTGSVVQVRNNGDVTIENCKLNGSGIIGVVAYNTKNLKVVDNYIYNNSSYGIIFDEETTIEITGNTFEDNGTNGNDHVGKALDAGLSQMEKMAKGTNKEGVKMSKNKFK